MSERWIPKNPRGAAPVMRQVARDLRRDMTEAEHILWESLRNRRLAGIKFRRQHTVGRFVLDFYASEHHLGIELDGQIHRDRGPEDASRTQLLESYGYRVLRFKNEDILTRLPAVLAIIQQAIQQTQSDSK